MVALVWNEAGKRFFEDGIDRGVLYPTSGPGVAWVGLISIDESTSGGDHTPLYFDGLKYLDLVGSEKYQATLTALSSPREFRECDGMRMVVPGLFATQQPRSRFHLCYRTRVGNDIDASNLGYKLHLVYNASAVFSGRNSSTMTDAVTPESKSWSISAVAPSGAGYKPTSHIIINSLKTHPYIMAALEDILYGTSSTSPRIPSQAECVALLNSTPVEPNPNPIALVDGGSSSSSSSDVIDGGSSSSLGSGILDGGNSSAA